MVLAARVALPLLAFAPVNARLGAVDDTVIGEDEDDMVFFQSFSQKKGNDSVHSLIKSPCNDRSATSFPGITRIK